MKFLVVFVVAIACASADVSQVSDANAPIVRSSYESNPEGTFGYAFETGNGIVGQADGVVKNPDSENAALEVTGINKYIAPDGQVIETSYLANENGYQPQGSHLPTAPPTPEYILRALDFIAANPPLPAASGPSKPNYG